MPLYAIRTTTVFPDALDEPYVWQLYIEAETEFLAKRIAEQKFASHIEDFEQDMLELKIMSEVKRGLIFMKNVGLQPLYEAVVNGKMSMEEIGPGVNKIMMTQA